MPDRGDRPRIIWNDRTLRAVNLESLAALQQANSPPFLFQSGRNIVRLRKDAFDISVEPLNEHSMRHHLDDVATFGTAYPDRQGNLIDRDSPPHMDFVRDLLAMASWPTDVFPNLKGIIRCPVFAADGVLITTPGYDSRTQLWYHPDPNLVFSPIPDRPTPEDRNWARAFLLEDFLVDFPFTGVADKANALAYMLTFFVREMILSPVPLALIEAPSAGTGKSLLAKCLAFPALGRIPPANPPQTNDDQWRKLITSLLISLPTVIWLDNITGTLRSAALETVLTGDVWQERLLVTNNVLTTRIHAVFIATANNLQIAGDLPRRIVWIGLDAKVEHPEERDTSRFRHPDLSTWMSEHRTELVRAALILIQAWIADGKPLGKALMGSFESWTKVIGGILQVAGVEGFLTDRQQRRRGADDEAVQWLEFCEIWWHHFDNKPVGVTELFPLVEEHNLLPLIVAAEKEAGRRQRLGHALRKVRKRCFGPYRIIEVDQDNSKRWRYQLELTTDAATDTATPNSSSQSRSLLSSVRDDEEDDDLEDLDQVPSEDPLVALCNYWWYVFGTNDLVGVVLASTAADLGLISTQLPREQQQQLCATLLKQMVGNTYSVFQVEHTNDIQTSWGDRYSCYRLVVLEGQTPPLTYDERQQQHGVSVRHRFTAEDFERIMGNPPMSNAPRKPTDE